MSNVRIGVPGAIGIGDPLIKDTKISVGIGGSDSGGYQATRPEPRVWNHPGRSSSSTRSERVHIERGIKVSDRDW